MAWYHQHRWHLDYSIPRQNLQAFLTTITFIDPQFKIQENGLTEGEYKTQIVKQIIPQLCRIPNQNSPPPIWVQGPRIKGDPTWLKINAKFITELIPKQKGTKNISTKTYLSRLFVIWLQN
ncbi:hypothetical protein WDSVgp3 [Walleye dermal sarcoma virus]|uniref:Protein ORF-C n=1 Tax=Walleye dermal sarcoma virus TaxID=39720 RepID=ORFC_WDSV|nr:hypothetical protein WDSVgp3 [Walleye dermal sarcoma virus]Q88936.1 RecName: Full=Protein ORF-C [Walleye dermal sarcoma virus]AAA99525.1 ORF-C [Walleye dermal sarcoma virus]AAC82606.1 ORF-C [Walleye dermal sarcoma virus]ABO25841.1 OrfC [Walleye dermal sarcoma virus]